jgi:hypothetical protein
LTTIGSFEETVQEKRAHSRVSFKVQVTCTTEGGAVVTGVTRDLSVGGAFVDSLEIPAFGSRVSIRLAAPGFEDLQISGIVRWTKPDGFGLQFQLLGAKETYLLAKLSSGKG